jgi:hypothetical protein
VYGEVKELPLNVIVPVFDTQETGVPVIATSKHSGTIIWTDSCLAVGNVLS